MIIDNKEVVVNGNVLKIAKLKSEYHDWVEDPDAFVAKLKDTNVEADLFTFNQKITDREPRYGFHVEWDSVAALPITTYEAWLKRQINDKTRNMLRRSEKSGVEVRLVEFSDDLVKEIKTIYDESPLRQGKPFKHYNKSLDDLKKAHMTFLDRSLFLGAYYDNQLIGFIKLVHEGETSEVMNIVSMVGHRDKAPSNALLGKAVEICAGRGDRYLIYGPWDGQSLIDFKKHHAFERVDLPRYFVPLNIKGKVMLSLKLHRKLATLLPPKLLWFLINIRNKYNSFRYSPE